MRLQKLLTSFKFLLPALIMCAPGGVFAEAKVKPHKASKTEVQKQLMQQALSTKHVAAVLDWVQLAGDCNLCHGYFAQPKDIVDHPTPLPVRQLPINISSNGPASFQSNGVSRLTQGVTVLQPGRRMTADTALVYRSATLGKVVAITLIGDVHLQQYNRLVVATYAHVDLVKHTILLKHALYHFGPMYHQLSKQASNSSSLPSVSYNAWGYAGYLHNPTEQLINLSNATYSTCSPLNRVWMVSGRKMHLDRNHGVGTAKHVLLHIKKVPVLYLPYFRFPIDNRRLTGFLMPSISLSKKKGQSFGFPFYWNMAPNYATTITPTYNIRRGFEMSDTFNYLSTSGRGNLMLFYLPHDRLFRSFRDSDIDEYSGDSRVTTYVNELRKMKDQRALFSFNGANRWNDTWGINYHLNYVTDPYLFRDTDADASIFQPNQLLNQFDVDYNGDHWQLNSMVQAYQTLHRIDQFDSPSYDQYQRLPQFDTSANYPDIWKQLNFSQSAEFVYFNYNSAFPTEHNTLPTPEGSRLHMRPSVDYNYTWASGYVDPRFMLDDTTYITHFEKTSQSGTRANFNQSRVMPIVDIDSGLYFDRSFKLFDHDYTQTLQPRLFYLYVPRYDQDKYPDFDTELLPFSYDQLFNVNRFSGYDRVENANQLSFGLTSDIIDSVTGSQRFEADLGIAYYMQRQRVSLLGATAPNKTFSPLVGKLTYDITDNWSSNVQGAWDFSREDFNNASTGMTYHGRGNRTFDFGYQFVKEAGSNILGIPNNTNQIYAGTAWPLFYHLTGFGYARYNFSGSYPQGYFGGLQYDSCCWALRFVFDREFTGRSPSSTIQHIKDQYTNTYIIQLQLKGLASVGHNDATGILENNLAGYRDPFSHSGV